MNLYIPAWLFWYVLGFVSPFALIIGWMVAEKITGKGKEDELEDEDSSHK